MRRKAQNTQKEIAEAMDWSLSKVIRIESGEVGIAPSDLRALLAFYEVTEQSRVDSLVALARASRTYSWTDYRDLFTAADLAFFSFEAAASVMRSFQIFVVPGLLQIEEYARAIITEELGYTGDEADRRWEARQRRQEIHDRDAPPEMFVILDESVVRRHLGGPRVMRRQLEHLKAWGESDHVTVQVLPFTAGAHPSLRDPFTLLEFADAKDDDLLYQESTAGAVTSRDEIDVTARYLERFYTLEATALSESDTLVLLDELIEEMRVPIKTTTGSDETGDQ
jgi:transcriptional regulator with XRE-family HTH domain